MLNNNVYMGATDMGLDGYKQGFDSNPIISSTLDHGVLKNPETAHKKMDITVAFLLC